MNHAVRTVAVAVCLAAVWVSWSVSTAEDSAKKKKASPKPPPKKKVEPPPSKSGTTVQLPTFGVAVDAEGVVSHIAKSDPDGRLARERELAARKGLPEKLAKPSPSRKISLRRLEAAIAERVDKGLEPDATMRHLAGLQRVESLFFYPDEGEIVLAGPADGWMDDGVGRSVGLTTGQPVVLLEDLAVALRAYPPEGRALPLVGCTINPTRDAWERYVEFQRTIPKVVPQQARDETAARMVQGSREALGEAIVDVLGISDRTHMAAVMVEADYRMKHIAIGLEPLPIKLNTYLDLLHGPPRKQSAQRWWFTPDYECLAATDDRLAFKLIGEGVILREENQMIASTGELTPDGSIDGAAQAFATTFTRKYGEIAGASPVYAELRNAIDLLIVAACIRHHRFCDRAGWRMGLLLDETRLPTQTLVAPKKADVAVNAVWKGSRLLVPIGGVTIHAEKALASDPTPDRDGRIAEDRDRAKADDKANWWWD